MNYITIQSKRLYGFIWQSQASVFVRYTPSRIYNSHHQTFSIIK